MLIKDLPSYYFRHIYKKKLYYLENKKTSVDIFAGLRVSSKVAKWYKDPSCQRDKADLKAGGQFSSKVMANEAVSEHLVPEIDKNCNKVCLVSSSMSALME